MMKGKYLESRSFVKLRQGKCEVLEYNEENIVDDITQKAGYTRPLLSYPYSLMGGMAGEVCYLSEILFDERNLRFPAYEV
jgi:hypothetical protein